MIKNRGVDTRILLLVLMSNTDATTVTLNRLALARIAGVSLDANSIVKP